MSNVKFRRVNGRIIPIRERIRSGASTGAIVGSVLIGAGSAAFDHVNGKKLSPFSVIPIGFWALKGAAAGGLVGGLSGLAPSRGSNKDRSKKAISSAGRAAATSFGLAAASSAAILSKPFVRSVKASKRLRLASNLLLAGSVAYPFLHAARNKDGNSATDLAAGGTGAVAGVNLLRSGSLIVKNRTAWNLRRFRIL